MERGAKSVRAAITHPVLSGKAYDRINESALTEVIERVHNYKEISSIFFH